MIYKSLFKVQLWQQCRFLFFLCTCMFILLTVLWITYLTWTSFNFELLHKLASSFMFLQFVSVIKIPFLGFFIERKLFFRVMVLHPGLHGEPEQWWDPGVVWVDEWDVWWGVRTAASFSSCSGDVFSIQPVYSEINGWLSTCFLRSVSHLLLWTFCSSGRSRRPGAVPGHAVSSWQPSKSIEKNKCPARILFVLSCLI